MNCEDFRHKTSPRSSVEVHYNIQGVADIALDSPIRELNSALENATRKSRETLPRRCCMDRREAARVTCIEKLQEVESLTSTYFAEDDPVGAVAKGCFQKVADAHCREAVLWLPSLETNKIILVHLNFGCVFD